MRVSLKLLIRVVIQLLFQTSFTVKKKDEFWASQKAATVETVGEAVGGPKMFGNVRIYFILNTNQKVRATYISLSIVNPLLRI